MSSDEHLHSGKAFTVQYDKTLIDANRISADLVRIECQTAEIVGEAEFPDQRVNRRLVFPPTLLGEITNGAILLEMLQFAHQMGLSGSLVKHQRYIDRPELNEGDYDFFMGVKDTIRRYQATGFSAPYETKVRTYAPDHIDIHIPSDFLEEPARLDKDLVLLAAHLRAMHTISRRHGRPQIERSTSFNSGDWSIAGYLENILSPVVNPLKPDDMLRVILVTKDRGVIATASTLAQTVGADRQLMILDSASEYLDFTRETLGDILEIASNAASLKPKIDPLLEDIEYSLMTSRKGRWHRRKEKSSLAEQPVLSR